MPQPSREPATEAQAQQARRALERGATVRLEQIRSFPGPRRTLESPRPVTVEIPDTRDLHEQLVPGMEPVIVIDFELTQQPDFAVRVFVNTPQANAETSIDAPGFVSTIAFFGHDGHGTERREQHGPVRYRLPAEQALRRTARRESVEVTLVPIAYPERSMVRQSIGVRAELALLRSEVR
jgi:hypothetical protein